MLDLDKGETFKVGGSIFFGLDLSLLEGSDTWRSRVSLATQDSVQPLDRGDDSLKERQPKRQGDIGLIWLGSDTQTCDEQQAAPEGKSVWSSL